MANEGKTSKIVVSMRIELQLCAMVERKYKHKEDKDNAVAYVRALEDATRDVLLTAEDYRKIAAQVAKNEAKRIDNRNKKRSMK